VRSAIAAYPGVDRAGLVSLTLPQWDSSRMRVRYDGLDPSAPEGVEVGLHLADEGLLPTLGVPIVEGRNLASSDGLVAAPVAVVSRSLAELMGGVSRAIGRHVTFAGTAPTEPVGAFRIVGVAGDVAYDGLVEQDTRRYISYGNAQDPRSARLDVYVPLARFPVNIVSIAAATSGDAASLLAPLRRTLAEVTPTSAVHWTSTMTDELGTEYAPSRFYALLVAAFSCSALAVTSLGLFALLSHAAARRSGEMGIRLALGATPRQVALLLLGGGFSPLIVGALLGIVGAGWAGAAMRGLLHDVGLFDLQAFAGALTVLIAVAVLAGAIPARRAASVDPLRIMTSE
jgi:putative ABC transport system permease protein